MPIQHLEGQLDLVEWIDQQGKKDAMNHCPTCGQEIREYREGVPLSALKARIFDAIKHAGRDGIDGDYLFETFLADRGAQRTVLKAHVYQINEKLAGTDYRIDVQRTETHGIYRLKRTKVSP